MSSRRVEQQHSLLAQAVELATLPLRWALSPLARRAYLSGFLLFIGSLVLLGVSSIAYVLFYYAYVPHAAVSVPIYLQYAHSPSGPNCPPSSSSGGPDLSSKLPAVHPFGTGVLQPALASAQKYDVEVVLHMPRSPTNLRAGNFMVDLALLAPAPGLSLSVGGSGASPADVDSMDEEARIIIAEASSGRFGEGSPHTSSLATANEGVVARARRPAILKYSSLHVDLLRKTIAAPWYALGWAHEAEIVEVGMLEDVEFTVPKTRRLRGSLGVPDRVRLLLESREQLEVYSVTVEVRARLQGLRWLMYKHRVLSFVVFTGCFYGATMGAAVAVYAGLLVREVLKEQEEDDGGRKDMDKSKGTQIKAEADGDDTSLSDTSRVFPSRSSQSPLKFSGRARRFDDDDVVVKKEEELEVATPATTLAPLDADDEDNADDYEDAGDSFRDSGIGTSREDKDRSGARRRKKMSVGPSPQDSGGWDGKGRLPGL